MPAGRPGSRRPDRALRCLRRRPRGLPRLEGEPRRHRHGTGRRRLRPREPGVDDEPRPEAAGHDPLGQQGVRDRRARRDVGERQRPRRPDDRPLAGDRPARRRSASGSPSRTSSPTARRPDASDTLRAIVERADGTQVEVFRVAGNRADVDGAWHTASIGLDAFAGQTIHLRFEATDGGRGQSRRGRARRHPGDTRPTDPTADRRA